MHTHTITVAKTYSNYYTETYTEKGGFYVPPVMCYIIPPPSPKKKFPLGKLSGWRKLIGFQNHE